jgi:hypothetical protein
MGQPVTVFSATSDFSTTSNTDADTWSYLYKENDLRDGKYRLIETFEPGLRLASAGVPMHASPGPDVNALQVEGDTPWVAMNTSGVDLKGRC